MKKFESLKSMKKGIKGPQHWHVRTILYILKYTIWLTQ